MVAIFTMNRPVTQVANGDSICEAHAHGSSSSNVVGIAWFRFESWP